MNNRASSPSNLITFNRMCYLNFITLISLSTTSYVYAFEDRPDENAFVDKPLENFTSTMANEEFVAPTPIPTHTPPPKNSNSGGGGEPDPLQPVGRGKRLTPIRGKDVPIETLVEWLTEPKSDFYFIIPPIYEVGISNADKISWEHSFKGFFKAEFIGYSYRQSLSYETNTFYDYEILYTDRLNYSDRSCDYTNIPLSTMMNYELFLEYAKRNNFDPKCYNIPMSFRCRMMKELKITDRYVHEVQLEMTGENNNINGGVGYSGNREKQSSISYWAEFTTGYYPVPINVVGDAKLKTVYLPKHVQEICKRVMERDYVKGIEEKKELNWVDSHGPLTVQFKSHSARLENDLQFVAENQLYSRLTTELTECEDDKICNEKYEEEKNASWIPNWLRSYIMETNVVPRCVSHKNKISYCQLRGSFGAKCNDQPWDAFIDCDESQGLKCIYTKHSNNSAPYIPGQTVTTSMVEATETGKCGYK